MCYDNRIKAKRTEVSNLNFYFDLKMWCNQTFANFIRLLQTYFPYTAWHELILPQPNLVPRARDLQGKNRELWDNP